MSRSILGLSTLAWQFGQVSRQPWGPDPADDRPAVAEWLPARVPGDVRADLIACGRIPPVETPAGIAAGAWVDDQDWWYRVELPGGYAEDEQIVLEADGIDYYSAVWLDDLLLATHAGMFGRQAVVLSPRINAPGPHTLAIRVWGGGALPRLPNPPWRRAIRWLAGRLKPGMEYFPDRMATPKAQFGFGWDFSPQLLSTGIWDELRLVATRGAYIEDLRVQASPATESADPTPAHCQLQLRVMRWYSGAVQAEITVKPESSEGSGYQSLHRTVVLCQDDAPACTADYDFTVEMANARRWWPWDQGEPNLYRVTVRLVALGYRSNGHFLAAAVSPVEEGRILDEVSQVFGMRSVAKTALPGGAPWQWVINGRPVFLRGANWVPADILPGRATAADTERLLGMARQAGINFLRVWGGGVREVRAFWETCDRLGIMAWQEFPLACAFLDHYPRDAAYLDVLAHEARGAVRLLRNHPSLVAWCGGNEISPERERLPLQAIASVLAEEDPARPFIPASPSAGDVHEWGVWHGFAPWARFTESSAPFMSEFGLQALPHAATVAEMFPGGPPRSLADRAWADRKAQYAKLRHYAGPAADPSPGSGQALSAAIIATQRAQATALQVGIEACRLRRTASPSPPLSPSPARSENGGVGELGKCGGVAFWQFNEPWPAVTWSVIDRAGRPKAAYEMLKLSYQPLLIAARFPWRRYGPGDTFRAELWIVNDGPQDWRGCRAEALIDGAAVWVLENAEVPPASARPAGVLAHKLTEAPQVLALRLTVGDVLLVANCYDLAVHLPEPQSLRGRITRWLAGHLLGA